MRYNELGQEVPDDTPLELPLSAKRPPSLQEQIQAMVRGSLSRAAERQGEETFDEANDFDCDDDGDFEASITEHEFREMKVEIPEDSREAFEAWRRERKKSLSVSGESGGNVGKKKEVSPGAEGEGHVEGGD